MSEQDGTVTVMPLDPGHFSGAIVVNVFALLSMFALVFVALRVMWLAFKFYFGHKSAQNFARENIFFRTRMGVYAACMLTGNLFASTAGVIGVWWLAERKVMEGPMCTAQAIFMSMGNIGTAYFTVVLAVHTFNSLVLRYRQSAWIGIPVIVVGWGMALAFSLFPLSHSLAVKSRSMYGPGDLTCGVQSVYNNVVFYHHLLPIFMASLLSAILYSLNFLVLRGSLVFKGGVRINLNPQARWNGVMGNLEDYHRFVLAVASSMLWYPIAYITILLPYSVTRMLILSGFAVPTAVVMFAFTCWYMLGVVNVLLLYNTFRLLAPLHLPSTSSGDTENESFGNVEKQLSPMTTSPGCFPPSVPAKPNLVSLAHRGSTRRVIPGHGHKHSISSDRVFLLNTISPVSELNKELAAISQPAPARLRSSSSDSEASLPSAPRSTRSPMVRYPTLEKIKPVDEEAGRYSIALSRDHSLQAFRVNQSIERDGNFAVSPRSSSELSDFMLQSSDNSTIDAVIPERAGHPPLSAVASRTSFSSSSPPSRPASMTARPLPPTPFHTHTDLCAEEDTNSSAEHSRIPTRPSVRQVNNHVRIPSNSGRKYYF